MNRYSYALNNPLRYVDPDGLDSWDALTKKEQELIGQKFLLQKGQTHRDAFNQLVAVKGDAKATTANTQSVKAFLGAVAKTDAWKEITNVVRVESNGVNDQGDSYTSTIGVNANRKEFLNALGAQGYSVNGAGDEVRKAGQTASRNVVPFLVSLAVTGFPSVINSPDHPHDNARASTTLETDPQLHFYNERGGGYFQAHWDRTSSGAVTQGPIGNLSGAMGHGRKPATLKQVNEYMKRTQKTPQ